MTQNEFKAIKTDFPSNFANGNTTYNVVFIKNHEKVKDSRGFNVTIVARSTEEALAKFLETHDVIKVREQNMEFIGHDWAGFNQQHGRFTHVPTGNTLLCKAWWGQLDWDKAQLEWFQQYNGAITVHECPGEYSMNGDSMGTVAEICERLSERLESS